MHETGGGMHEPNVRYSTRRHWFELVAETSDFLFWSAILTTFTIGLVGLFGRQYGWLLLLCFYPLLHLATELIRWNCEWYIITDEENATKITKLTMRVFSKGGKMFKVRRVTDSIRIMTLTEESTLFDRWIGYRRLTLVFGTRTYLEGQRVPVRLLEELSHRPPKKKPSTGDETERTLILSSISDWVQDGLIERPVAAATVERMIVDNL